MKAQWLGGPNDGEVIEIPHGIRHIVTPSVVIPTFLDTTSQPTMNYETIEHPIIRRPNGGLYIQYKYKP